MVIKKLDAHANINGEKKELGGDGENGNNKSMKVVKEEEEDEQNDEEKVVVITKEEDEENASIFYEIDFFIAIVLSLKDADDAADNQPNQPPALPDSVIDRITVDDVQKMQWESLQAEIATWIQVFRHSISVFFPHERNLCESVFSGDRATVGSLFNNLARSIVNQLLNFVDAVAMTKGSAEKLFRFLDMYEALRDMLAEMDILFPGNEEATDLKSEISTAQSRLGETAAAVFCELEGSIKADAAKAPVPGGAVHPLTRYVMNYLKYACEYKKTLEQVFMENQTHVKQASLQHTPLATQLVGVMELLDSKLESKSKLYKEMALGYIFLMNNGMYIVKKIKESTEIYELVGDNWYRKRSGELRQYHKNYQRETWSKVLGAFKEDGLLQVKGSSVSKVAVKERMKSFNTMFEEIHKTQSSWLVSDEQLKSELRVSITAVLVPAYRSSLGRYRQHLNGRQDEKYIEFGPEDIETKIEELFEGNPSNHGHGRKKLSDNKF